MRTSETYHTSSALRALRLINKARQCAKRGDVNGMCDYTEQAYIECACAPTTDPNDRYVDNMAALRVTHQIRELWGVAANWGACLTYVRYTRYLSDDVHELVEAMQKRSRYGI